ncbi:unnamed protein product [Oikopleura dioica]|uniref:Uncharacterized protein n=1 Tax=Oikopleura dioica TaxID=34765 RepID=E4WQ45_OIKDI|nr:unnamed protein product [Oikopleura dioica]CBY37343.1 unnamed protein product [Oikopleura dioica]
MLITKLIIPFTDKSADKDACGARGPCRAHRVAFRAAPSAEIYKLVDPFGVNTSTQVNSSFSDLGKAFKSLTRHRHFYRYPL